MNFEYTLLNRLASDGRLTSDDMFSTTLLMVDRCNLTVVFPSDDDVAMEVGTPSILKGDNSLLSGTCLLSVVARC